MNLTANVIDLAHFRKRKQAQQLARAMWDMYARNAGYPVMQSAPTLKRTETRHA